MVAPIAGPVIRPTQVPAATRARIDGLDHTKPLQPLSALDVVPDGKITLQDAASLEALGRSARQQARRTPNGAVAAGLAAKATDIGFAAQQARYAVALGLAPAGDATIKGVVATPGLAAPVTPKGLIDQIRAVDVAKLRAAGVRPVATFDVDGTTIKGDIYVPFMELMAKKGHFGTKANEVFTKALSGLEVDQATVAKNDANANALLLLEHLDPSAKADTPQKLGIATMFFTLGDAMAGQKASVVNAVAKELMETGVGSTPAYKSQINDDSAATGDSVRSVVGALREAGIKPMVVTYGYDWLAKVAAPYVGFNPDDVIGTHSEIRGGIFTGVHNGRTIPSKDQLVRQLAGTPPLFAFGDSGSDLPMLDIAAGRGVVVNPSSSMRTKMQERNGALGEVRYSTTVGTGTDAPA